MILNLIIKILLYCCLIATLLTFLPGSILLDIKPTGFKVHAPKNLDLYKPIELTNIEKFEELGPLSGPESIGYYQGRTVSSSADGHIYEVIKDRESNQISFKKLIRVINESECLKNYEEFTSDCGHPLGIKFDSKGALFVVEPSRGIYRIKDIFSSKPIVELVLNIKETGSKFLDDLAIQERPNGKHIIFITDVSKKFKMEQIMLIVFGSDTGRVLQYDMETGIVKTLVDSLLFPNGIEVTPSGDALFFAEFVNRSIHKYHLSGEKKGNDELLISNLPSEIDNVRLSASGKSLWLAMLRPQTIFTPSEMDYYLKKPLLRKLIARASNFIGEAIKKFSSISFMNENSYLKELGFDIQSINWLAYTLIDSRGGLMLEVDFNGKILSSIYSQNDTRLERLSEVREIPSEKPNERTFYLGSYSAGHLRKLVIKI